MAVAEEAMEVVAAAGDPRRMEAAASFPAEVATMFLVMVAVPTL
jgi:phosphoribosyl-ATP pyrophosphohydrolase